MATQHKLVTIVLLLIPLYVAKAQDVTKQSKLQIELAADQIFKQKQSSLKTLSRRIGSLKSKDNDLADWVAARVTILERLLESLTMSAGSAENRIAFDQEKENSWAEFDYIFDFTKDEIAFTLDNPVRRTGVRVIDVKKRGLVRDGVADDGPALRRILESVRKGDASRRVKK